MGMNLRKKIKRKISCAMCLDLPSYVLHMQRYNFMPFLDTEKLYFDKNVTNPATNTIILAQCECHNVSCAEE